MKHSPVVSQSVLVAAAHMAATGAGCPVQSPTCRAAWWTSIPSPLDVSAPCGGPGANHGLTGGGTPGPPRTGLHQQIRVDRPLGTFRRAFAPMPSGVALTTRSQRVASPRLAHSPDRAGQYGGRAPAVRRPVDHHHLGRPGVGQADHDRPGRTARPHHQAAAPVRVEVGAAAQRGHQSGTVGVVTPDGPAPRPRS